MRAKITTINKVSSDGNLSDALTEALDAAGIQTHLEGVGIEIRTDDTCWRLSSTPMSKAVEQT